MAAAPALSGRQPARQSHREVPNDVALMRVAFTSQEAALINGARRTGYGVD